MKKVSYIISFLILASCTSNTILEKPKDLIPRDTMSLLIQELMIASSARYVKNKDKKKGINYMPLVYDKFKIDSIRFQNSNYYYMSKIDDYIKIFEEAKVAIDTKKEFLEKKEFIKDSLKKDSLRKVRELQNVNTTKLDSIKKMPNL